MMSRRLYLWKLSWQTSLGCETTCNETKGWRGFAPLTGLMTPNYSDSSMHLPLKRLYKRGAASSLTEGEASPPPHQEQGQQHQLQDLLNGIGTPATQGGKKLPKTAPSVSSYTSPYYQISSIAQEAKDNTRNMDHLSCKC